MPLDASPGVFAAVVPAVGIADVAAARRRRHRVRTPEKLARLRVELAAWARVALALRVADDADAVWDAFLDADVRAARALLRRLGDATRHAQRLAAEHALLTQLLADHRLAVRAIATSLQAATEDAAADNWAQREQRWRALARVHFRAWTAAQCAAEIETVLRALRDRAFDDAAHASGLSVLGWRDSECRFPTARELHFSLHKTFWGFALAQFVDATERIFTDTALYGSVVHGGHARVSVDVLQRPVPHVAIVMYHEAYAGSDVVVHSLSLNARVERADGSVTQFYRPIDAPAFMRAFSSADGGGVWMRHFHWANFEPLVADEAYRVSVRGVLAGEDQSLARYWRFRVLESLVRVEARAARRELLEW